MKNLIAKTISGFITLLAILGVCTMLPAWTIYYPQAWIYLLVFAVAVILITIYLFKNDPKLLERRVKAGPAAEKEKHQKIIQSLASFFFVLIYVVSGFDYRFHWSGVPMNISLFADVFVALGFYVVFLVFRQNSYTSAVIEVNEDQKVISTGPYGIVRHPMYSGAMLMLAFTPIALGSYWGVLCVIPMFFTIVARLLDEEKFLSKNLPGYNEYCRKVHYHLIPLIW